MDPLSALHAGCDDRTHTPALTPARLPGGVHSPLTHPSPPPKLTLSSFTERNPSFTSTRALDSHNTLAPSSVSRSRHPLLPLKDETTAKE